MPALIYKAGTAQERIFPLRVGFNGVGRDRDNQVVLRRADISRTHAEIAVAPGRVILKDLGSSNHSFVNGRKVTITELSDGDEVRFSSIRLTYRAGLEAAADGLDEDAGEDAQANALSARIAEQGRVEDGVTPERRAELEGMLADGPAREPRAGDPPALLRARGGTDAEPRQTRLEILLDLANRLSAPTSAPERMAKALELLLSYLDVDAVVLLEQQPARRAEAAQADAGRRPAAAPSHEQRLRPLAVRLRDGSTTADGGAFWQYALARTALAKGGPVLTVDDAPEETGVQVDFCLPLGQMAADAVLYLTSRSTTGAYSDDDMELIGQLAEQIGIALANARALDVLRDEYGTSSELQHAGNTPVLASSQLDSATGG